MPDSLKKPGNLILKDFPQSLDWEPTKKLISLQSVFKFVDDYCTEAIDWYHKKKRSKQRFGCGLRLLSITSVAVAGIIPVISEIICKPDGTPCISPGWATVAIAIAALLVALDRFSGYTSGWVRYVRSAHRLTELQGQFRLDWCMYLEEKGNGTIDESGNTKDTATYSCSCHDYGLRLCKKYIVSVNSVLGRETDAWAQEFQQVLVQFETPTNQNHASLGTNGANANGSGNSG
jgi:hypothetical protein